MVDGAAQLATIMFSFAAAGAWGRREIDPADAPQWDRARWPELRKRLSDGPPDGLSRPPAVVKREAWTGSAERSAQCPRWAVSRFGSTPVA